MSFNWKMNSKQVHTCIFTNSKANIGERLRKFSKADLSFAGKYNGDRKPNWTCWLAMKIEKTVRNMTRKYNKDESWTRTSRIGKGATNKCQMKTLLDSMLYFNGESLIKWYQTMQVLVMLFTVILQFVLLRDNWSNKMKNTYIVCSITAFCYTDQICHQHDIITLLKEVGTCSITAF